MNLSGSPAVGRPLGVAFKGARTYVQGGDIVDAIQRALRADSNTSKAWLSEISIRRFVRHDIALALARPDETSLVADVIIEQGMTGDRAELFVVDTGVVITDRIPFDEDALVAPMTFPDARTAVLQITNARSAVEVAIAVTKVLCYRVSPAPPGKWVFGKLNLESQLPLTFGKLRADLRQLVGGRFAKVALTFDDKPIGHMSFIVGTP